MFFTISILSHLYPFVTSSLCRFRKESVTVYFQFGNDPTPLPLSFFHFQTGGGCQFGQLRAADCICGLHQSICGLEYSVSGVCARQVQVLFGERNEPGELIGQNTNHPLGGVQFNLRSADCQSAGCGNNHLTLVISRPAQIITKDMAANKDPRTWS